MRAGAYKDTAEISLVSLIKYTDFIEVELYVWLINVSEKSLDSAPHQYIQTTESSSQTSGGDWAPTRVGSRHGEHLLIL